MILETILIILAMIATLLGPALVIGTIGQTVIKSSVRNPSLVNQLYWGIFVLLILVEIVAVGVIIVIFNLFR